MISFTVPGRAQPAGSKRAFPYQKIDGKLGVRVSDDNPKAASWKERVAICARAAYRGAPLEGPVSLNALFRILRPPNHAKQKDAPSLPIYRPDLLKLARGLEDALKGILYLDDSQIVTEYIGKVYSSDREETLVQIEPIAARFDITNTKRVSP